MLAAACAPGPAPAEVGGPPALTPAERDGRPTSGGKAAPHWQRVTNLAGSGGQRSVAFEIAADVLQWRVTATCDSGHVRVAVEGEQEPLVDQACPGRFFGFAIHPGRRALDILANGSWEVEVDQQVDEPLAEPPVPGMTDRSRLAAGPFRGVEQEGSGVVTLHRLPGGGRALRLDPFFVTANDDLFIWASEAASPRTSADAVSAPHVQLGPLRATAGSQNYLLPESVDVDQIRSIVIWCEPVRTAYAAAALRR